MKLGTHLLNKRGLNKFMSIEKKLDWGFKIGVISSVILILVSIVIFISAGELVNQNFYYAAIAVGIAGALVSFGIATLWLNLKKYELIE